MKIPELAIRTAKKHVQNYEHESLDLMATHCEAMDCRDCEDFLQLGIDAFDWLVRATKALRSAAVSVDAPNIRQAAVSLRELQELWLRQCVFAEKWVAALQNREFKIDNLEKYRECCNKMHEVVSEDGRMRELLHRVPPASKLDTIATDPPDEWIEEPSWQ